MAQVQSIQDGTITITDSDGSSVTQSITSVATANSILIMKIQGVDQSTIRESKHFFTGELTSSAQITFTRESGSFAKDVDIYWTVVEFDSSVTVTGYTTSAISSDLENQTITAVADLTDTFLITSWFTGTIVQEKRYTARLTSTTNIEYDFEVAPGDMDIYTQVVEFASGDIDVEHLTHTWAASDYSDVDTISSVTVANTAIAHNNVRADESFNIAKANSAYIELASSTTTNCERYDNDATSRIVAYSVVEFLDGTTVEQGLVTIADTDTTPTTQPSFTAVSNGSIFEAGSGNHAQLPGASGIYHEDFLALYKLDATNDGVTVERVGNTGGVDIIWTVIDWNASGGTTINGSLESLEITENAATVSLDVSISAALESLTMTENQASTSLGKNINAALESLALTENQSDTDLDKNITANLESLELTEFAANVQTGNAVSANLESLEITEFQASLTLDVTINASTELLEITENQASTGVATDISANLESLDLTEFQATVTLDGGIFANTETLSFSELSATITASALATGVVLNEIYVDYMDREMDFDYIDREIYF